MNFYARASFASDSGQDTPLDSFALFYEMANNNDTTTLPLPNNTTTPNGLPVTLHDTSNGHTSGLPTPTGNTTVPQLPQTPRKQKWIPDPNDSWSDPKHPEQKTRPRTLVLCFDGTGDQFDDDVGWIFYA